jgi:(1->4)-alpha-D-glucan 1-alpha-D-glucosylmutase
VPAEPIVATYRLQLHPGFTFVDAAGAVPFLADLGISHLYLSPVLQAVGGSRHGYDVVDVERISTDLGGDAGFALLRAQADAHGLGLVLDIVPHHLAIGDRANRWWWEVLTFGESAPHAHFFDIDWRSPEARLRSRIVLPVLDDHVGRAVDRGTVRLVADPAELFVVQVGDDMVFPLSPASTGDLVLAIARGAGDEGLAAIGRSLIDIGRTTSRTGSERVADDRVTRRRAALILAESDSVAGAQNDLLARLATEPDAVDAILDQQVYRLARWQVSVHELDYRRFFDINTLVALRTSEEDVFAATHVRVGELVREGAVDGLRVDHIDGMADPAGYCDRLRSVAPNAWLLVEKILAPEEHLRSWPVDGTTGYDLAAVTTPFLVDPRGEVPVTEAYRRATGDDLSWEEHAVSAKAEVLDSLLGSDVARLVELLVQVCERRRRFRDFTRTELHDALVAVASHTPAYRSYMRWAPDGHVERAPEDAAFVRQAVGSARQARPDLDGEVFDLLQLVLGFGTTGPAEQELAVRFQQLTGPAMAKGEEDTALYRACRLLALDDVGHDPSRFSISPDDVHRWACHVADEWPATMLTTSTHDTKRSEDVRARLAVLAEVPEQLEEVAQGVCRHAEAAHDLDGHTAWFVVQTVIGAWPASRERLWPALEKSFRESKRGTSWLRPDARFETSAAALLDDVLDHPDLRTPIERLTEAVTTAGWANALVLTTLRCTLPGVPDTYQGCDRWSLALVDPDNRRDVDFARHAAVLGSVQGRTPADCWAGGVADGGVKQALLRELLHLRRRGAWSRAPYTPIAVSGPEPLAALAFQRDDVVVLAPRFPLSGQRHRATSELELPPGRWRDLCTGDLVDGGRASVSALTGRFPVAVLERER